MPSKCPNCDGAKCTLCSFTGLGYDQVAPKRVVMVGSRDGVKYDRQWLEQQGRVKRAD